MRSATRVALAILFALFARAAFAASVSADLPSGLQVPAAARPGPGFDVEKATEAYIALLSPAQRERSDAYFEGGYWIELWDLLYGLAVAALLLFSGISRRMREAAERASRRPWLSTLLYAAMWIVAGFVLAFPFDLYTGFFREHAYGLSEQPFASWLADRMKGLAVGVLLGSIAIAVVYAAVRKAGARWWIWATAILFAFNLFVSMVFPVFIAPLFNKYEPLPPGPAREAVLSLARANGIPTEHVEWFNASKQTTRISANVSGLFGTTRVNLNDNLVKRTSLPEIKAVLGHEMGHYVLNHSIRLPIYFAIVFGIAFRLLHFLFDAALARWGARLGLRDRGDPAALPLAVAILSVLLFLASPMTKGIVRQAENEADAFGLNAAREPYGFATVSMRLATYRKIVPGPLEELLFFDHPSGYERVHRAMVWLKENLSAPEYAAQAAASRKP
jgi:STE24 endopeptidase